MDIPRWTESLRRQRDQLDHAIKMLEALETRQAPILHLKRGRKGMTMAERREVSVRMRKYWAKRRKQRV